MRRVALGALCVGVVSALFLRAPAPAQDPCAPRARSGGADSTLPRIIISVDEKRLWVVSAAGDTLRAGPIAVGSDRTLSADGKTWTFTTPRGVTTVAKKEVNPLWIPPDWHYVELARKYGFGLERLSADKPVALRDGSQLVVRGDVIGTVGPESDFEALPGDEEIIFDGTLYVPPFGTRNRLVAGTLGTHRLLLCNGLGLHGTPDQESIGKAVTHGCIRLRDEDIAWLYANVPIGARVVIR